MAKRTEVKMTAYEPITCCECGQGSPAGQAEPDVIRQMRETGWRYRQDDRGRIKAVCGNCVNAEKGDW